MTVLLLAILASPAVAAQEAPADDLIEAVERVSPKQNPLDPGGRSEKKKPVKTTSIDGDTKIVAAVSPATGETLELTLPDTTSVADSSSDGSLVVRSKRQTNRFAVQSFDHGTRVASIIMDRTSPVSMYDLGDGRALAPTADGGAIVHNRAGEPIGQLSPPWARDALGRDLPTKYTFSGSQITQIVDLTGRNIHFPVVADPYIGVDLIASASWAQSTDGWRLEVTPTQWARANAYSTMSYMIGVIGWDELFSKYRNAGLNTNLNGMRDQYICHQVFVGVRYPNKPTWNLDEWRPDVGWWETVSTQCNPGGDRWFD
ncbi:DUF2599 domain-containing protein [Sinomonas sp. ASV322]|uniref:DUF2599 domain-containing protein n=1 Tax=Sinomonas sp. ASV322 TaxID=3041920 RepID=UPI0027DD21FF|nr:DUF2599 domain-containing protein [Sinomonas sp. ASV322]MDQ4500770.1 DUF2599 domain-containing protein [Sinomonas sp. ASV322]